MCTGDAIINFGLGFTGAYNVFQLFGGRLNLVAGATGTGNWYTFERSDMNQNGAAVSLAEDSFVRNYKKAGGASGLAGMEGAATRGIYSASRGASRARGIVNAISVVAPVAKVFNVMNAYADIRACSP